MDGWLDGWMDEERTIQQYRDKEVGQSWMKGGGRERVTTGTDTERERRMWGSTHFVTEQKCIKNAPATVAMATKGKLFHVSHFVAHGYCPETEGWMIRERSGWIEAETIIINNQSALSSSDLWLMAPSRSPSLGFKVSLVGQVTQDVLHMVTAILCFSHSATIISFYCSNL